MLRHESEIFQSIRFKPYSNGITQFKDPNNKYTFDCPTDYITSNFEHRGKKLVQAIADDDFYFFQESPEHDTEYIEEDAFEAKYIHTSFYKTLDIKTYNGDFTNGIYKSYESSAILDTLAHKKLWLKSIVKDGSYYLLGYYGAEHTKAKSFFTSLKFNTLSYNDFNIVKDTSLYFTVNSPVKAPLPFNQFYRNSRKRKPYDEVVKHTVYTTKANEEIQVERTKFHDLKMYQNSDSLWNSFSIKDRYLKLIKSPDIRVLNSTNEKRYSKNGINYLTHNLKDSASSKIIMVKYIQKQGVLYKLSAVTDSIHKPSKFLNEFFNSFQPLDTLLGEDIFKDKTTQFFEALKK